jgi:hypothetical protein
MVCDPSRRQIGCQFSYIEKAVVPPPCGHLIFLKHPIYLTAWIAFIGHEMFKIGGKEKKLGFSVAAYVAED